MRINLYLFAVLLVFDGCTQQAAAPAKKIYNRDFNWTITIPAGFQNLSAAQYAKLQQKGTEALQKTYGKKVENHTHLIFSLRSDQFHYIEANQQPFDTTADGNYLASCKAVDEVLFNTFKQQMPDNPKIDSANSTETIDHMVFQRFKVTIGIPDKGSLNLIMYNRLFDKKELTVTIMYVDTARGNALLNAMRSSKFE
jgi:hypothetical protein